MSSITWNLCALCQEVADKPLECLDNSKDVKQNLQIYTGRVNFLKQFQTAERLSEKFRSVLHAFLSSYSSSGKLFKNKNAKWHASWKAYIIERKLWRKNATETVPVEPKNPRSHTIKFDPTLDSHLDTALNWLKKNHCIRWCSRI